ncbi:MAG: LPS assembly lipoprotein LptE [Alphaproteobacteria bacterium]
MWLQTKAIIFVLAAAMTLSACGFRPLYAERTVATDVSTAMAAITIAPIKGRRLGNDLRRLLLDRLTPHGTSDPALYRLEVEVEAKRAGLTVEDDETFSRFNMTITATYKLLGDDGQVLTNGVSHSVVSSSINADPYATHVGEGNAQQRATRAVADDIKMRLALFFDGIDG